MRLNPIFQTMPVTVFETMSGLARQHDAINLGQGFPDAAGPEDLRRRAADAVLTGSNQYAPSRGLGELRAAVVEHYVRLQGVPLSVEGVCVTSGATEAIAASLLAVIRPGDEVIVFEPAYDAYRPLIERGGGTVRVVRLIPPLWRITPEALARAVGPRTRAVVFNSPHNPTGRAFDTVEVAAVAALCIAHDLIAISDEVWEHVIFDGRRHISLLSQPGMVDRVIKIGSAGKMFGLTGWKIGFACGAPELIDAVAKAHQFLTFATPPNLQSAVAEGLAWPQDRFEAMRADLGRSRDRLAAGLLAQGYVCAESEGTYFLCLDLAASGLDIDDQAFCSRSVSEFGVAAIPVSSFEADTASGTIVRLCFAKGDAVLDEAIRRLSVARSRMQA
ncbi:aminotransferase [soil metagenome]